MTLLTDAVDFVAVDFRAVAAVDFAVAGTVAAVQTPRGPSALA